jgi:hypothetical protein
VHELERRGLVKDVKLQPHRYPWERSLLFQLTDVGRKVTEQIMPDEVARYIHERARRMKAA